MMASQNLKKKGFKMKQTIKGYLPIFKGFYGSNAEEIFYYRNKKSEFKEKDFDYYKYQDKLAREYVRLINESLEENCMLDVKFEFEKIESPRFYNFSNDEIQTKTIFDEKTILNYVNNNFLKFDEYCKENFTSFDGFLSFYPNNANEFLKLLDTDKREAILNHIICFAVENLIDKDEIESEILDFCYEVELELEE
jgi:hypothetical protein